MFFFRVCLIFGPLVQRYFRKLILVKFQCYKLAFCGTFNIQLGSLDTTSLISCAALTKKFVKPTRQQELGNKNWGSLFLAQIQSVSKAARLVVWQGSRWFGFLGSLCERDCYLGVPGFESSNLPSVESIAPFSKRKSKSTCTSGANRNARRSELECQALLADGVICPGVESR